MESFQERGDSQENIVTDLAMGEGSYTLMIVSVGDYLAQLGLYNVDVGLAAFDSDVAASFQRVALDIGKNPIKQRMLRDLCRGGTLPPLVVLDRPGASRPLQIIDGFQRTHVLTEGLRALIAYHAGDHLEDYAHTQLVAIKEQGQKVLSVKEFLSRPVILQLWKDLQPDELVRLFMVLNAGQQKVSPRHLLEVIYADLRSMFEAWGMRLLTEKEEKMIPKRRGRKPPEAMPIPSTTHFRFEFLIDGLIAYASRDPQLKTRGVLEERDGLGQRLSERIAEIGNEVCKSDFQWVCLDLNKVINKKYADVPKWRGIIQTSDNFFIPLLAALGEARGSARSHPFIDRLKGELSEFVTHSKDEDPLRFFAGGSDSLEYNLGEVKSNIGRRRRAIIYFAWRFFFRQGVYNDKFHIDWRGAAVAE